MTLASLTSDSLPVRHGFFTRQGGASSGVYASLNCGSGSTDQREMVSINRDRVARHMGVAPDQMASVYQVHSADVLTLSEPTEVPVKADGMVTNTHLTWPWPF